MIFILVYHRDVNMHIASNLHVKQIAVYKSHKKGLKCLPGSVFRFQLNIWDKNMFIVKHQISIKYSWVTPWLWETFKSVASYIWVFCVVVRNLRERLLDIIRNLMWKKKKKTPSWDWKCHKSHIGQKKCFTLKYREKCIYFVLTEHTFYYEHWTHIKVYIFRKLTVQRFHWSRD